MKRGVQRRRATITPEVRNAVKKRSGGFCVVCLYRVGYPGGTVNLGDFLTVRGLGRAGRIRRIAHLHHVLPVQSFARWELNPENLVGICAECHDEHERAHRRIPYTALPVIVRLFAQNAGGQESMYIHRTYPKEL